MLPLLSVIMGPRFTKRNGASQGQKINGNVKNNLKEAELLRLIRQKKCDEVAQLLPTIATFEFTNAENVFTALQLAVILGNVSLVKTLLDMGAEEDTRGFDGKQLTPLQLAAKYGRSDIATVLVDWGACVKGTNDSDPPIHIAVYHGQLEVLETLLSMEVDNNSENLNGGTLLHSACAGSWNSREPIRQFDHSYLTQSMSNQHDAIVQRLILNGIDVNQKDSHGNNSLHVAAERGNGKIIRTLLDCGVYLDAKNLQGDTFLHKAAQSRFLKKEDLMYMLNVCAGHKNKTRTPGHLLNIRNKYGYTALHNAIQANNHTAVQCLLDAGADATTTIRKLNDPKSWRIKSELHPVQMACVLGNYQALQALPTVNHNLWAVTKEGRLGIIGLTWISLIDAFKAEKNSQISLGWYQHKNEETFIKIATELAPEANDVNAFLSGLRVKRNLLHFSVFKKRKALLCSLCENPEVNLEILDGNGKTALQASLAKKNIEFVDISEVLVEQGANIHVPVVTDNVSKSVLTKAIELGATRLVTLILLAGANTEEEMAWTDEKHSILANKISCSIIEKLLLADFRLSLLYFIHGQRSSPYITKSTLQRLEAQQSVVFSLKRSTRKVIRNQLFHSKHIDSLPLPKPLKSYLMIPELQDEWI